jgi:hypothetical protein
VEVDNNLDISFDSDAWRLRREDFPIVEDDLHRQEELEKDL